MALKLYMRTYVIPPTLKDEKEKIIGGVLNITEAAWIFFGGIIAIGIFLLLGPVSKIFGAIVGVTVAAPITFVFGFLKIKGYPVLKYAKYKKKFNNKKKLLPNKRNF